MTLSRRNRSSRRGGELVEFSYVILPFFAIIFLIMDVCWMLFAKSSVQFAVREGVRYAVTSQTMSGMGQKDSIKTVVQQSALGFLKGSSGYALISVTFPSPTYFPENAGGNVVEVSVSGLMVSPMLPLLRSSAALNISASSADIIEPSPSTGAPVE